MRTLPYDYSRCANDECAQRNKCLRYLSPGRPGGMQVFTAFTGGEDCDGFISAVTDAKENS